MNDIEPEHGVCRKDGCDREAKCARLQAIGNPQDGYTEPQEQDNAFTTNEGDALTTTAPPTDPVAPEPVCEGTDRVPAEQEYRTLERTAIGLLPRSSMPERVGEAKQVIEDAYALGQRHGRESAARIAALTESNEQEPCGVCGSTTDTHDNRIHRAWYDGRAAEREALTESPLEAEAAIKAERDALRRIVRDLAHEYLTDVQWSVMVENHPVLDLHARPGDWTHENPDANEGINAN